MFQFFTTSIRAYSFVLLCLLLSSVFLNKVYAGVSITPPTKTVCSSTPTVSFLLSGCSTYSSPDIASIPVAGTGLVTINVPTAASYPATFTYTVNGLTAAGGACNPPATFTLIVEGPNNFTPSAASSTICEGTSTNVTLSPAIPPSTSISWSPSYPITGSGSSYVFSPLQTQTYTATATKVVSPSLTCTLTKTLTLTVTPKPSFSSSYDTINICAGESADVAFIGTGVSSYTWSTMSGVTAVSASAFKLNPTSSTSYVVTPSTVGSCLGNPKTIVVNVRPLPVIAVTPSATTIAAGSSTTLTASGGTSYTWKCSPSLSTTSGATVTASPTSTTTYTVMGVNNGCISQNTATVSVSGFVNSLNLTTSNNNICPGQSATLTANVTGTVVSYAWSPSTSLSATNTATVVATPSSTTTYTCLATYAGGSTISQTITINILPANFTILEGNSFNICNGLSRTVTCSNPSLTYACTPSTGVVYNSATQQFTFSPSSNTVYNITGSNASGCNVAQSVSINVNAVTSLNSWLPSNGVRLCYGEKVFEEVSGGNIYTWSPAAYVTPYTPGSVSGGVVDKVWLQPPTTTTFTVTSTNGSGCLSTFNITVDVSPLPSLSPPQSLYNLNTGDAVAINLISDGVNFNWAPPVGLNTSTAKNVIASPSANTTYRIFAYDVDYFCAASTSIDVVVGNFVRTDNTNMDNNSIIANYYPNPSNQYITFDFVERINGTLQVYNMYGDLVIEEGIFDDLQHIIDVGILPNDAYYFRLITENNIITNGVFKKQWD